MQYLVSIYFDPKTDKKIRTYIEETAKACGNTYMFDHQVPPHITISGFETGDEEAVLQCLEEKVKNLAQGSLQWVAVGALANGVLYIAPVLNQYLQSLAETVYDCVKKLPDIHISKYYQPFQWLPHTTVGKKLSEQQIMEAFAALQTNFHMFEGNVVKMGLAQKNPYREIREWKMKKRIVLKKVAFICVHNSCRSQIAEALGKHLAAEVFESYSAGTETKPQINQDAVRIMKEMYGIDMEQTQYSKLITDIPNPDIAISMGCNVGCPFIGRAFDDNWGLEDPTGKPDEEFKIIIKEIEKRVLELRDELI